MKTILLATLILNLVFPARAMVLLHVQLDSSSFTETGFNDWRSDQNADGSTVRATLTDNPTEKRWELQFWNLQTGSKNLTSGLDVTLGTQLHLKIQKYPNGDFLGRNLRYTYIFGSDVKNFAYSDATDTIELDVKPVAPAKSASFTGQNTAAFGMYFYYSGMAAPPITYSPPVTIGNVFPEDVRMPQHPSSALLWGKAFNVNGVNGEPAQFEFVFGSSYADRWGFPLDAMKCYLDGELPTVPSSGFSYTGPSAPSSAYNMGIQGETFKSLVAINVKFSAHDIQAGVFRPRPQFNSIQQEAGGLRVNWNAETNRRYILEYFATLGGATNVLGTNLTGPSFLDPAGITNTSRFYRLREQ